MDLWFTENHTENVRFSIKVDKQVYSEKSEFQRIDVFDSPEFGRMLTLDGYMMLTERDEFIYHEMLVHLPMCAHGKASRVLVIGGGDGGTLRELLRYDSVEHIDLVEIDAMVIEACRKYFPWPHVFDDKRVSVHIADGLKFVRRVESPYDLILVDSTDPFGPGEGLFTREFYGSCYRALGERGIMVNQHESPFYPQDAKAARRAHQRIKTVFPVSMVYQAHIPTYPSGHWLFGFASKGPKPQEADFDAWEKLGVKTRYYNSRIHQGAFLLPTYVEEILEGQDEF